MYILIRLLHEEEVFRRYAENGKTANGRDTVHGCGEKLNSYFLFC